MEGFNWLLGFLGAVVSVGVLVAAGLLGWKILRSTIELLRTAARPSLWTLLYYAGVLMLILVVVSVFIPTFFSSLASGIRDSREHAQDISMELNGWIIQSIENAQDGGYGSFATSAVSTPWNAAPTATVTITPTLYVVPNPPSVSEPSFPTPTSPIMPTTAPPPSGYPPPPQSSPPSGYPGPEPLPTYTPYPTATPVPTIDASTWNLQTPPPTPETSR